MTVQHAVVTVMSLIDFASPYPVAYLPAYCLLAIGPAVCLICQLLIAEGKLSSVPRMSAFFFFSLIGRCGTPAASALLPRIYLNVLAN